MNRQPHKSVTSKYSNNNVAEIISLVKSVALFLCIAVLLRASVVEAFKIPSSSMMPTLEIGDHILVNKMSYGFWIPFTTTNVTTFREPSRGDIVVFTLPDDPRTPESDESETNIIKRIVGMPGDIVEVRGTRVYINDEPLEDNWGHWLQGGYKDFGPERVPDAHVFLLGDNRDYSKDSRFWLNPYLSIDRIKGRAFVIYWNAQWHLNRLFSKL